DVDREQPSDVGPVDGAAAGVWRPAHLANDELSVLPVGDRIDEAELGGSALLAQQMDVVPESRKRLREPRVVDIRPGSTQEVAVKDEHAHDRNIFETPDRGARERSRLGIFARYARTPEIPATGARIRQRG